MNLRNGPAFPSNAAIVTSVARAGARVAGLAFLSLVACAEETAIPIEDVGDAPAGVMLAPLQRRDAVAAEWQFRDGSAAAGAAVAHMPAAPATPIVRAVLAGVAAGDIDDDGDLDIFAIGGSAPDQLLLNRGDGTFEAIDASERGIAPAEPHPAYGSASGAPLLADLDGDGTLDLFVGGSSHESDALLAGRVYLGRGDGTFVQAESGIAPELRAPTLSVSAADYDLDGDLDLLTSHWTAQNGVQLWQNSRGNFVAARQRAGLDREWAGALSGALSANFVDLGDDGFPELLAAIDFRESVSYANDAGQLSFIAENYLDDFNGMGSAFGDFDGDLRIDWFVSAIDEQDACTACPIQGTGNRLYRNLGGDRLMDMSQASPVRSGDWGWAACAADLDLDGDLDLVHTNGMIAYDSTTAERVAPFAQDALRVFLNDGAGGFVRRDVELGIDDRDQGRGLLCADFDRDGDLDVFVHNHGQPSRFWRNELSSGHAVTIELRDDDPNTRAIGARIWLRTGDRWQVGDVTASTNYASQGPAEVHFGVGAAARIDELWIRWPDVERSVTALHNLPVDQLVHVDGAVVSRIAGGKVPDAAARE